MLRRQDATQSRSRPLDLTVQRDAGTSSLYLAQQSLPLCLTGSTVLQSPPTVLRHSPCPCPSTSSQLELRFRPYSFGPARSLVELPGCRRSVDERPVYSQWIHGKLEPRRRSELRQRHPALVSPCWTSAPADRGQFIIIVITVN